MGFVNNTMAYKMLLRKRKERPKLGQWQWEQKMKKAILEAEATDYTIGQKEK